MISRVFVANTIFVTLLVLSTLTTLGVAQPAAFDPEIQTADVNGATLHYFEHGEGEPLVFVHGSLGDLHTFSAQVEEFAKEFRVIAYSRRFHPPNDPPQAEDVYSLQLHVADLAALVRELKAGPAYLVGNSYGAYIALAFAVEQPELVHSLVLGEPPVLPLLSHTSMGKALRESWDRRVFDPSRSAFESGDPEAGLRLFLDGVIHPGWFDQLPEEVRTDIVAKYAAEFQLEVMTKASSWFPPLACGALGQLKRPILLVTGELSPTILLFVTGELERCLEGESFVMVPESGHGMHQENAAFYNQAVLAFLRSN